ncbi:MAG: DUF3298 and DUF4163 domain-containing protein [Lachnospiraceae bacterium]|nr:DUF3298 and DUF4163 domain-containing protein [Lachnospiraceae bacterium]
MSYTKKKTKKDENREGIIRLKGWRLLGIALVFCFSVIPGMRQNMSAQASENGEDASQSQTEIVIILPAEGDSMVETGSAEDETSTVDVDSSDSDSTVDVGSEADTESAADVAITANTEYAEDAVADAETDSAVEAPRVSIETAYRSWYSEDGEQWIMYAECGSVSADGEGYEALSEAVSEWNEEQAETFWSTCGELAEYAAEDAAYENLDADSYYYNARREMELTHVDENVLSLVIMEYAYTGGAHGNYGYTSVNFDVTTGEILELNDIMEDAEGFRSSAQAYLIEILESEYGEELFGGYEDTVAAMWDTEPTWYLSAEGITFVFDPYELGSYATGAISVTCPYAEVGTYMKAAYSAMDGTGAGRVSVNTDVETTRGLLRLNVTEDEYEMLQVSLELNGETAAVADTFGSFGDAYLLSLSDGRSFVLFDADYMSDDYVTFLYEITDGSPILRSRLEGVSLQDGNVGTEVLTLRVHLDVLGTYNAYMDYVIAENGELMQTEDIFEIRQDGYTYRILTVTKDLPVTMDSGEAAVLPAGTRIRITGSDDNGTAYFRDEDSGEKGSISYERGNGEDAWTLYIDGISEYEYFEMIPYAG